MTVQRDQGMAVQGDQAMAAQKDRVMRGQNDRVMAPQKDRSMKVREQQSEGDFPREALPNAATPDARELKGRTRASFASQAATYDTGTAGEHARRLYPHVLQEVLRACRGIPQPRILDLGCGTGALAERVLAALPAATLVGVDMTPQMIAAARTRCPALLRASRMELVEADAEHLPFHDGSFDVLYCNDSFHHYPDPQRAAFQMWRVLARGGVLVMGEAWQPAPARAIMNAWLPHADGGDVRIYGEGELRALLGNWFDCVSWKRVGMTACLAVARKE